MKKFIFLIIIFKLTGCTGYEPVFSSKDLNLSISKIEISKNDKISQKIKKKLKPYEIRKGSNEIIIEIKSLKTTKIIAKDAKGDPSMFNLIIQSNIKIYSEGTQVKNLNFREKFSYKNQQNKFELNQYKNSIENELINKIFEKIILNLRTL